MSRAEIFRSAERRRRLDRLAGRTARPPAPRAERTDRGSVLARPTRTVEGTVFEGRVARTGDHNYPWGVERRDQVELEKIVRQLTGAPVTLTHPQGMIRAGARAKVIGRVLSARVDGDHAVAS